MAVYGATAFVLLQVADLLAEGMGLSDQVLRITTFVVLIGFPIAVVLAWAFETTPEGVKRTADAAPAEISAIIAQPASKRWPAGLLALAGMGLLFWGGWWMGNSGTENPANIIVSEAQASEFKSLAVLPFENVNGDEENRLISMGVHEDLLSQLSRIAALRVTSRTSVREYEDTEKGLKEIAGELGVEFIMEGSVRSSGNQVRVTVTLIDAATDELIWNHQYDKEVTPDNLFQIQSEVARSVVAELEAQLTPQDEETLDAMKPASSLAAQSWYHRGVEATAGGVSAIELARDNLTKAIELDPEFVAAWHYLTRAESRLVFIGQQEGTEKARAAMERTVELAPGSVEALLARGYYAYYGEQDFPVALTAFRQAERLAPSNADVIWAIGLILRRQGDWEESTETMKRAVVLDPRYPLRLETLAENLSYMGAHEDANTVVERELAIDPTNARARASKIRLLVHLDGNTGRASRLAGELGLDPSDPEEATLLVGIAMIDGDYERALEVLGQVDTRGVAFLEHNRMVFRAAALHQLGDPSAISVADSLLANIRPVAVEYESPAYRALAHALAGRNQEALSEARLTDRLLRPMDDHVGSPDFAADMLRVYGLLGELDAGLNLLEAFVDRPSLRLSATNLKLRPAYDPYRDDPRFDELIQRREAFEAEGAAWAEARRPWLP
jgi:TolB-like protein/Tfp pilus assembly protein PilF